MVKRPVTRAGGKRRDQLPRCAVREDAVAAASHDGSWPAGGSFTTRADRTPGQAATAATAAADGS